MASKGKGLSSDPLKISFMTTPEGKSTSLVLAKLTTPILCLKFIDILNFWEKLLNIDFVIAF